MKIKKRKMTAAEIKEAIKRDKEWMNRIDPDEEIEVPKGMLKSIFEDPDNEDASAEPDSEEAENELDDEDDEQVIDVDDDDGAEDDDDKEDADDGGDDIGGGKMVGALLGGVGGLVLGSILGAALMGDD